MSFPSAKDTLMPSLLDRLIEPRGGEGNEVGARGQTVRELEESVRRDLQELLNSRRSAVDGFPEESELSRSLLNYGLPELTGFDPTVPDQRRTLQSIIEQAIRSFEPRLDRVHVTAMTADSSGRGLRMSVEALLKVSPSPVPVAFDTVIKPGSEEWQVVQAGAQ